MKIFYQKMLINILIIVMIATTTVTALTIMDKTNSVGTAIKTIPTKSITKTTEPKKIMPTKNIPITENIMSTENIPAASSGDKGMGINLCTGEMISSANDDGSQYFFYAGDQLTEEAGICNSRVRHYCPPYICTHDINMAILVDQEEVIKFDGLIFPFTNWRIGRYVENDFNWNKDTNYCFVEKYTTRGKSGQDFPLLSTAYTRDKAIIPVSLWEYLGGMQWDFLDTDIVKLRVININKPLSSVTTDRTNYYVTENQKLRIKLTLTDNDFLCGKPDWGLYQIAGDPEYQSAETFEIRINNEALPSESVDQNTGAFGAFITTENQGEITIEWDSTGFAPGNYDLNISVIEMDGYHEKIWGGGSVGWIVQPFVVEQYLTQIDNTIHVTVNEIDPGCQPSNGEWPGNCW